MSTFNTYNSLLGYNQISYNIISYLMQHNENIWKILKYDSPDALSQPNLSQAEKAALIYNGEEDSTPFRVFRDEFMSDDAFGDRVCQLRIYPMMTEATERVWATQDVCLQIVCHVKINHLENYITRRETLIEEIISTLNGCNIGMMSPLYWDGSSRRTNKIYNANGTNNKNFVGSVVVMSCKVGKNDE